TMFSGFYLALFLILVTLILRCTGIEFRSQLPGLAWRKNWDMVIAVCSILSAVLWGVAVSNLVIGVPIDENMQYAGSFFTLLRPFCLLGGVMLALIFLYHGACFLMLKAGEQTVLDRVQALANKLGPIMIVVTVLWVVWAFFASDMFKSMLALVAVALAAVCMILSVLFTRQKASGKAFIFIGLAIAFCVVGVFAGMFPNIMISTIDPSYSLDIYNAASSPKTLGLMTKVAFALVPIVLVYQIWSFYVFRKRVTKKTLKY
ncbi:MAG: cytochrome d ubiquinol oxidase subunit II, partial [Peptococcaceae bacterium]|nr:cytochrome d ubiquinol oxidase subunit II [Peptococcaceae bacterium]